MAGEKARAISKKCLDCSGDSVKEVTLCHIVDCPLWEYRFGNSLKNNDFKIRIMRIKERSPKDFAEMLIMLRDYYQNIADKRKEAFISTLLRENKAWLDQYHSGEMLS